MGLSGATMILMVFMLGFQGALLQAQELPWSPSRLMRFWDQTVNPLEFRAPIRFIPYELKGGLIPYGGPGMFKGLPASYFKEDQTVFVLDSTESAVASIRALSSRLALVFDAELGKLNLRNRFWPLSVVDVMVGAGLRTSLLPLAQRLPENWPQGQFIYRIAPVFHLAQGTVTVNYQRSERRYMYFQYARGIALGSVYRAGITGNYLRGVGTSVDWSCGYRFFRRGTGNPRYALGIELRYSRLDVATVDDPDDISPIEGLEQRSFGLIFTFSTIFGGRATAGDRAKRALYTGDFMAAERDFGVFISDFPQHTRQRRAERLLQLAARLVPYQQVQIAQAMTDEGRLEEALQWYDRAIARGDTNLTAIIDSGRMEIGYKFLQRADRRLSRGELDTTGRLLKIAQNLMPAEENLVRRYSAEVLIQEGHRFRGAGDFNSALRHYDRAIAADSTRTVEITGYKARIAEDLLKLAITATDRSALALALESVRRSRELDPGRKQELDLLETQLQERLDKLAQAEIRQAVEGQMNAVREARDYMPPTKPQIGMLVSQIEEILGPPDHITKGDDQHGANHQLWEYGGGDHPGQYYFENYELKRVELLKE